MRKHFMVAATLVAALLAQPAVAAGPAAADIVRGVADIGAAMYGDAAAAAATLRGRIAAFLADPSAAKLAEARQAWIAARIPQAEAASLAFASPLTAQWQRQIDAWPIAPGLIDYAAADQGVVENPLARADVVANRSLVIGGQPVDAATIDRALLMALQGANGITTNVAAGYHVIEFLLWGEDGARPASDYALAACTHGACARRRAYLTVATDMLVGDLTRLAEAWAPGGDARAALLAAAPDEGVAAILTAIGDQSFQALAGARMKLSLVLHDTRALEDRFSGASAIENRAAERGIAALYRGRYHRIDGTLVSAPSLADLAAGKAPAAAAAFAAAMVAAAGRLDAVAAAAGTDPAGYGGLIAATDAAGNHLVMEGVHALVRQARAGVRLAEALGLHTSIEGGERLAGPPGGGR